MCAASIQAVRFGRETLGDLEQAERREWWLTNGLGAYAAGTLAGTLTRRYHGLLIAPLQPPLGRVLLFAKADATLIDGGRQYALFANRWPDGVIEPRGYERMESFSLDGRMPVWRYAVGDLVVESRIWMEQGANTTYVAWRLIAGGRHGEPLRLAVRLLVNARDHHALAGVGSVSPAVTVAGARMRVDLGAQRALHLHAVGGTIAAEQAWVERFDLPVERERGLGDRDNHLGAGVAQLDLWPDTWVGVVGTLDAEATPDLDSALQRFRSHEARLLVRARAVVPDLLDAPDWINRLVLSADSFVFARPLPGRPGGTSVIAGYPWFGDWGRDTMIALAGLTLPTGRYELARTILETFARFIDGGMLPNYFPGAGETPEYNTVDAALWYIEAWRAYLEVHDDLPALRRVFPVLADIVRWHRQGTRFAIRVDEADGLLRAGEPGVQLTWMDAKVGDVVVTPRAGKPVEINALWYNALHAMIGFAARLGEDAHEYVELAGRARNGFARFVHPAGDGLYDVVDGPEGDDATVRPNQLLAVSLPASPLAPAVQAAVVRICGRELLASCGLRSLAPAHPAYRSHYRGGVWDRDSAYHQGPVWAWLLGHFALAEYRVTGDAVAAQQRLEPLRDHLTDAALGSISEIFDGAPPHRPRGAPMQAWSVACTLEAWWRLERVRKGKAPARAEAPIELLVEA